MLVNYEMAEVFNFEIICLVIVFTRLTSVSATTNPHHHFRSTAATCRTTSLYIQPNSPSFLLSWTDRMCCCIWVCVLMRWGCCCPPLKSTLSNLDLCPGTTLARLVIMLQWKCLFFCRFIVVCGDINLHSVNAFIKGFKNQDRQEDTTEILFLGE